MNGKRNGKKTRKPKGLAAGLIARMSRPVARHLSDLVNESLKQPGSWQCLEIVYRNEPRTLLDRFFLNNRSARGARNRLQVFQEEVSRCVERLASLHNPVRLISFGSGPGHEVIGCIERLQGNITLEATCVDKDPRALKQGRLLANQKGLSNCIKYVQGNVLRMDPMVTKHDIGILSGLLDYFDFETAVLILKAVREQLLPSGTVFVANMRQHYLASTMSVLGNWNLVYREPEDVKAILSEGGYVDAEVWLEAEKVFCIGRARRPG